MKYVVGNWKMHTTVSEAIALAGRIEDGLEDQFRGGRELPTVVLCPPFTALSAVGDVVRERSLAIGAQNCHWETDGPYTGEIAADMLQDIATYVIIGHSERRAGGETDTQVAGKLEAALAAGLIPILCVGDGKPEAVPGEEAAAQLEAAIANLDGSKVKDLVVAYEPVWAIGGEEPADEHHIREAVTQIKDALAAQHFPADVPVLYGGSATPEDAGRLATIDSLSGLLVGHESLNDKAFLAIVDKVANG